MSDCFPISPTLTNPGASYALSSSSSSPPALARPSALPFAAAAASSRAKLSSSSCSCCAMATRCWAFHATTSSVMPEEARSPQQL